MANLQPSHRRKGKRHFRRTIKSAVWSRKRDAEYRRKAKVGERADAGPGHGHSLPCDCGGIGWVEETINGQPAGPCPVCQPEHRDEYFKEGIHRYG